MQPLIGSADGRTAKTKGKYFFHRRRRYTVVLAVLGAVTLFVVFLGFTQLGALSSVNAVEKPPTSIPPTTAGVETKATVSSSTTTEAPVDAVYAYSPAARGAEGVIVPLMSVAKATNGGATFAANVWVRDEDRLGPQQLPSWSLHVVDGECDGCTDRDAHAATLASAGLRTLPDAKKQAVLATTFAPLGLVGPMLLAMASVTDDVDSAAELPLWPWVRHGFGSAAANASAPLSPHLAVMATPSTDQTYRVLLREGQRATWRTFSEVARRENNFVGALLPLYFFAAGGLRAAEATPAYRASIQHVELGEGSATNVTALLPTVAEVKAAEACQAEGAAAAGAGCSAAQRRVQLRTTWRSEALAESPCSRVTDAAQGVGPARGSSQLANISSQLSLPVVPAFTAPARFICHASSALWLEALEHRDVLWLDMYTDVVPTTKKTFGMEGSQGAGAEIAMSQKSVLWLNYAYYQFPDIAYIIKGDDDMYVKVPQFLSNLRWLRGDHDRRAYANELKAALSNSSLAVPTGATSWPKGDCLYLGNPYGGFDKLFYKAGMLYLIDRRVVRGVLERPRMLVKDAPSAKDRTIAHVNVVRLMTFPYSPEYNDTYNLGLFHQEDLAVGNLIWQSRDRVHARCPGNYVRHVKQSGATFYDLRYRKGHLRWSSVVLHRCFPPDFLYIHRYMQTENAVARRIEQSSSSFNEADAIAELLSWGSTHIDHSLPKYGDWVPAHFQRDVTATCGSTYVEADNTTIYHTWYREVGDGSPVKKWYHSVPLVATDKC